MARSDAGGLRRARGSRAGPVRDLVALGAACLRGLGGPGECCAGTLVLLSSDRCACPPPGPSEKGAKLAQKLGQLQPFTAVFLQEYMGQPSSFMPT